MSHDTYMTSRDNTPPLGGVTLSHGERKTRCRRDRSRTARCRAAQSASAPAPVRLTAAIDNSTIAEAQPRIVGTTERGRRSGVASCRSVRCARTASARTASPSPSSYITSLRCATTHVGGSTRATCYRSARRITARGRRAASRGIDITAIAKAVDRRRGTYSHYQNREGR